MRQKTGDAVLVVVAELGAPCRAKWILLESAWLPTRINFTLKQEETDR